LPLRRDALQKCGGRLVGWVLGDELALERALEERLAKAGGSTETSIGLALRLFYDGEAPIQLRHNLALLSKGRQGQRQQLHQSLVERGLVVA